MGKWGCLYRQCFWYIGLSFKTGFTVSYVLCIVCMFVQTNVYISIWDCFLLLKFYIVLLAYLQREVISLESMKFLPATQKFCLPPPPQGWYFFFIVISDLMPICSYENCTNIQLNDINPLSSYSYLMAFTIKG